VAKCPQAAINFWSRHQPGGGTTITPTSASTLNMGNRLAKIIRSRIIGAEIWYTYNLL